MTEVLDSSLLDGSAAVRMEPWQRAEREVRKGFALAAVVAKTAGEGFVAMFSGLDGRLLRLGRDLMCHGEPLSHFIMAVGCFPRQVQHLKQAVVVAAIEVGELSVNVCDGDGRQWHSRLGSDERLHGDVVAVVFLHASGGFHLDHAPAQGAVGAVG